MLQKSVVLALLALISTIGWMIARQVHAVRHANLPPAQHKNSPQLQAKLDAGLGQPETWREVASRHGWKLNYREALETARAADKPLMIVFRCVP